MFLCFYSTLLMTDLTLCQYFFFFNDAPTTEIYTLSLHDALPIYSNIIARIHSHAGREVNGLSGSRCRCGRSSCSRRRSEEHTSELQSHSDLVCRLLLEKKKKRKQMQAQLRADESHNHLLTARAAR